jgi:hypothetical protein
MSTSVRTTFTAAATAFLELTGRIPTERYAGPGLGDWDLRSLVGHTGRALVTVATYVDTRADTVAADSPAAYFAAANRVLTAEAAAALHQRGVDAGLALGADPVTVLRESWQAAEDALDGLGGEDPVINTFCGGMRVGDYLPTRTFELTVHSLDIACATGLDFSPPQAALAESLAVASASAVALGMGVDVLLALTGRQPLSPSSSVVG